MGSLSGARITAGGSVLLTGATGFLGSALLRKLLQQGRDVVAVVRAASSTTRIADLMGNPRLHLIDNSTESLAEAFSSRSIISIIHTATEYGRGNVQVASVFDSNLIFPIRLAEMSVQHGVRCFINTDSYFNKPDKAYSNLPNYSFSKRTFLTWLKAFSSRIKVVNIILEHIYGPYDSRTKFVEQIIRGIALERLDSIPLTHGHQKRDFIFIDDVVEAYMKVLHFAENHEFAYKEFEVGTGSSMPIRDLVLLISHLSNSPTRLDFGAIEYRDDEIMNSRADIRNMQELGWSAVVSVEQGVIFILEKYLR